MEILIIVAAVFIALSALFATALRFGADSRDGFRSEEHRFALHGGTWAADPAEDRELALELRAARARRARLVTVAAPATSAAGGGGMAPLRHAHGAADSALAA